MNNRYVGIFLLRRGTLEVGFLLRTPRSLLRRGCSRSKSKSMHRRRCGGSFLLLPPLRRATPLVDDNGSDVGDDGKEGRNERNRRHRGAREMREGEVRGGRGDAVRKNNVGKRRGGVVWEEIRVPAGRASEWRERTRRRGKKGRGWGHTVSAEAAHRRGAHGPACAAREGGERRSGCSGGGGIAQRTARTPRGSSPRNSPARCPSRDGRRSESNCEQDSHAMERSIKQTKKQINSPEEGSTGR